jgi:hypothetical protein
MTDDMILYALPVFGVLMLAELLWGLARGRNTYGTRCEPSSATTSICGAGVVSRRAGEPG